MNKDLDLRFIYDFKARCKKQRNHVETEPTCADEQRVVGAEQRWPDEKRLWLGFAGQRGEEMGVGFFLNTS